MELDLIRRATLALCEADGLDEVHRVLGALFARLGIDQYVFISVTGCVLKGSPVLVSNCDERWQALYRSNSYQCIDPFVRRLRGCPLPFLWSELSSALLGSDALAFLTCARLHRIDTCRGATVPAHVRGEQVASLHVCQRTDNLGAREIGIRDAYLLSGLATTLHLRIGELSGRCGVEPLTCRERQCLLWAARGKSQADVALILGVSARTVRFHHENAMRKLDTVNIAAAVASAAALGQI